MTDQILFVDDEPSILDGYRRLLQRQFRIATANGGQEGLSTIERLGPFAVVISDMQMPGMNGAEFLGHVRLRAPSTVRMLLTGYADVNAAIEAVNKGNIFRYLTKPCAKEDLVDAIHLGLSEYHSTVTNQVLAARAREAAQGNSFLDSPENLEGIPRQSQARTRLVRAREEEDSHVIVLRFSPEQSVANRQGQSRVKEFRRLAAAFLQQNLPAADQIFEWNDYDLLAVLRRRHSPEAVRLEVEALISGAREYVARISGALTGTPAQIKFDVLTASEVQALLAVHGTDAVV